jgi:hypothetical protein
MLQDFFGRLGKPPDGVTSQDVLAYAHGVGLSGREPSAIGQVLDLIERLAGSRAFERYDPGSRRLASCATLPEGTRAVRSVAAGFEPCHARV